MKVKLFLKPNAKTIFRPKRPVPFNTIPLVEAELTSLQSLNILEPANFPNRQLPSWRKGSHLYGLFNGIQRFTGGQSLLASDTVFSFIDLFDAYLQLRDR